MSAPVSLEERVRALVSDLSDEIEELRGNIPAVGPGRVAHVYRTAGLSDARDRLLALLPASTEAGEAEKCPTCRKVPLTECLPSNCSAWKEIPWPAPSPAVERCPRCGGHGQVWTGHPNGYIPCSCPAAPPSGADDTPPDGVDSSRESTALTVSLSETVTTRSEVCTCAVTEWSQANCAEHGVDDPRCICGSPNEVHDHGFAPHCPVHDAADTRSEVEALADTDALADWLGGQVEATNVFDSSGEATTWIEIGVDDLAQRFAHSDWLAQHDAQVAAEAWDECVRAVANVDPAAIHNPYRQEQA